MSRAWQRLTLGELTTHRPICYGVLKPGDRQRAGVPLIRITDIGGDVVDETELYLITEKLSAEFKRSVLKGREVLLSIQGTIGRVAICPPHLRGANISRTLALIDPDERMLPEFLRYWLLSLDGAFPTCGSTRASLNIGVLREMVAPVPPIAEQQRIVGILDEASDGIATAKANAEQNLRNARALFESHLQAVFSQRGPGWVERKLEEIGKTQTGSTPSTSDRSNYGNFISFVKPGDFNDDGTLDYDKARLSEYGAARSRIVPAGSVLMVCIGATIGKCGFCDRDVTTNQQVNSLKPADGTSGKLIYYQMLTAEFQRKVIFASGQATLPIINKSKWSALSVCLPIQKEEQDHITARLDALLDATLQLALIYQRKLGELDLLKKSLLHRAFSGQL